jgi:glyoxylase-like metal-dependent hydrolase (beta-lactamase superfamily II)
MRAAAGCSRAPFEADGCCARLLRMGSSESQDNDISTVLISHFHPDHVWGLMEKGTNAPTFANAELVVNGVIADRMQICGRRGQGDRSRFLIPNSCRRTPRKDFVRLREHRSRNPMDAAETIIVVETPQQAGTPDQKCPAKDAAVRCGVRTAGFDPSKSD